MVTQFFVIDLPAETITGNGDLRLDRGQAEILYFQLHEALGLTTSPAPKPVAAAGQVSAQAQGGINTLPVGPSNIPAPTAADEQAALSALAAQYGAVIPADEWDALKTFYQPDAAEPMAEPDLDHLMPISAAQQERLHAPGFSTDVGSAPGGSDRQKSQ